MAADAKQEEIWAEWIRAIIEEGRGLSDWEEHFIESLSDQFDRSGSMSPRQAEILERIYTERTGTGTAWRK